jgi:predicted site-specific integrase-resolvase
MLGYTIENKYLNSCELAGYLLINRVTLYRYRKAGIIPNFTRVHGAEILWAVDDIYEFITTVAARVAELDARGDSFSVKRWERHIASLNA